MEYLDVVDDHGLPTGYIIERSEAHKNGVLHRTSHIWIIRKSGDKYQVLLQKRSADKDSYPGRYDTTSAGHILAGDEPLDSAIREFSEELGLFARKEDLQFIGNFHINYKETFYGKLFWDNEYAFVYLYTGHLDLGNIKLQPEEVERVDWFDLEEVYRKCNQQSAEFCVPIEGLRLLRQYIKLYL